MAIVRIALQADTADSVPGTTFPQLKSAGSNLRRVSLSFDSSATEACQWNIGNIPNYGSGDVSATVRWYADTALTGSAVWGVSLAAITPGTDTTNVETKGWATEASSIIAAGSNTHQLVQGTIIITGSSLDSIAANDDLSVRCRRIGSHSSDTMAGDGQLTSVVLAYSDT